MTDIARLIHDVAALADELADYRTEAGRSCPVAEWQLLMNEVIRLNNIAHSLGMVDAPETMG